jgi:hypothetical protein
MTDEASYSPDRDDDAMSAIASAWTATSGDLTVSLCEDLSAREPSNPCQVEHVVRGNGLGREHVEDHGGGGCGGCPFGNAAYVTGRVSGGGLPPNTMVRGEIYLGSEAGDDAYGFPYNVGVRCVDPALQCNLSGTLDEDGTLHLSVATGGNPPGDEPQQELVRTDAATCP